MTEEAQVIESPNLEWWKKTTPPKGWNIGPDGEPGTETTPDPSPLEPGVWLWPAYTTSKKPLAKECRWNWEAMKWEAYTPPEPEPEPEPEPPTGDDYRRAIQTMVDGEAQSKRYDNGASLASYAASTVPTWAAEANAFIAWRDQVWAYAYTELDKVQNGEREQPSVEDFLSELPSMEWPA